MYNERKVLFLKVITPLHAGSGTDLRTIDLPIQREVHTGFPKIEASTLKGCMRRSFNENGPDSELLNIIFGNEGESELSAAAIAITDAKLLFFPVRSAKGVYALITCPMVLERFQKEMALIGIDLKINIVSNDVPILASKDSVLKLNIERNKNTILLDEYQYDVGVDTDFGNFCKRLQDFIDAADSIVERAVLLPDDDFKDFVMHATSIVTRIKVGTDGIVENQALFTEEYLPEESILYSLIMMGNSKLKLKSLKSNELMETFSKHLDETKFLQIGADETLGKGLVESCLMGGDKNE